MGKKRSTSGGGAVGRMRRANVADDFLEIVAGTEARLRDQSDGSLFVVDTAGSTAKRKRVVKEEKRTASSAFEERKVQRIIAARASSSLASSSSCTNGKKKARGKVLYDAWAVEDANLAVAAKRKQSLSAVSTAYERPLAEVGAAAAIPTAPGFQSYNPSLADYTAGLDKIIDRHTTLEARRGKRRRARAQTERCALVKPDNSTDRSGGIVAVGGSKFDEEENDVDDDDDDRDDGGANEDPKQGNRTAKKQGQPSKLTRAQRNKQARKRETERALEEKSARKVLLSDAARAREISKEVAAQIKEQERSRELQKASREASRARLQELRPDDPRVDPIALPEELRSTLREIKVAGGLLKDQLMRLKTKNLVEKNPTSVRARKRIRKLRKRIVDTSSGMPDHMRKW